MKLNIKSDKLKELLKKQHDMGELIYDKEPNEIPKDVLNWVMMHPETTVYGYFESFMLFVADYKISLDLTYNTIRNLPTAIEKFFDYQENMGYTYNKNCLCMAKTLASYLTFLSMNEHGFWFSAKRCSKRGNQKHEPLWADEYAIMTGKDRNTDFLPVCMYAVFNPDANQYSCFKINVDTVAQAYKNITGVDLQLYGFQYLN